MSQAHSDVSAAEPTSAGAERGDAKSRSWWATLPGMLTAAAGLISAITGLVVAVQQLRPSHSATTQSQVSAPATTPSANPGAATTTAAESSGRSSAATSTAAPLRVGFPDGRHVEANGGLRYDFLSARTTTSNPRQLALARHVRLTNPGRYDANFWGSTFRLRVGADTSAPTNFLDDLVHGGTTEVAEIDFAVSASTRRATLLVGDDPAQAIALPLTLEAK